MTLAKIFLALCACSLGASALADGVSFEFKDGNDKTLYGTIECNTGMFLGATTSLKNYQLTLGDILMVDGRTSPTPHIDVCPREVDQAEVDGVFPYDIDFMDYRLELFPTTVPKDEIGFSTCVYARRKPDPNAKELTCRVHILSSRPNSA
jgi:hypothetical protein